jgi:hypothetical protein
MVSKYHSLLLLEKISKLDNNRNSMMTTSSSGYIDEDTILTDSDESDDEFGESIEKFKINEDLIFDKQIMNEKNIILTNRIQNLKNLNDIDLDIIYFQSRKPITGVVLKKKKVGLKKFVIGFSYDSLGFYTFNNLYSDLGQK